MLMKTFLLIVVLAWYSYSFAIAGLDSTLVSNTKDSVVAVDVTMPSGMSSLALNSSSSFDGNAFGESIPTNITEEKKPVRWVPLSISAVTFMTGVLLAVVENIQMKNSPAQSDGKEDRIKELDGKHSAQTGRAVGLGLAVLGATGIGLSFAF